MGKASSLDLKYWGVVRGQKDHGLDHQKSIRLSLGGGGFRRRGALNGATVYKGGRKREQDFSLTPTVEVYKNWRGKVNEETNRK